MRHLRPVPLLLVVACLGGANPSEPTATAPYSVLFVGNSLTYSNNLPGLLEALARAVGNDSIGTGSVAFPDFSLGDHLAEGTAARTIQKGGWDVVILQQGPSALEESRQLLLSDAARFNDLVRAQGGRPALYMVWPSLSRPGDFDRSSESYRLAAQSVQGILLPCGEAWRAAWRLDPSLALYAPDGLHPSVLGTYVCAIAMLQRLTGRSPLGLPASVRLRDGSTVSVAPATAALLQQAALDANTQFP